MPEYKSFLIADQFEHRMFFHPLHLQAHATRVYQHSEADFRFLTNQFFFGLESALVKGTNNQYVMAGRNPESHNFFAALVSNFNENVAMLAKYRLQMRVLLSLREFRIDGNCYDLLCYSEVPMVENQTAFELLVTEEKDCKALLELAFRNAVAYKASQQKLESAVMAQFKIKVGGRSSVFAFTDLMEITSTAELNDGLQAVINGQHKGTSCLTAALIGQSPRHEVNLVISLSKHTCSKLRQFCIGIIQQFTSNIQSGKISRDYPKAGRDRPLQEIAEGLVKEAGTKHARVLEGQVQKLLGMIAPLHQAALRAILRSRMLSQQSLDCRHLNQKNIKDLRQKAMVLNWRFLEGLAEFETMNFEQVWVIETETSSQLSVLFKELLAALKRTVQINFHNYAEASFAFDKNKEMLERLVVQLAPKQAKKDLFSAVQLPCIRRSSFLELLVLEPKPKAKKALKKKIRLQDRLALTKNKFNLGRYRSIKELAKDRTLSGDQSLPFIRAGP